MADEFFYKQDENSPELGPLTAALLKQFASAGQITPTTLIRRDDGNWTPASEIKGLSFDPPTATPVAEPVEEVKKAPEPEAETKSKIDLPNVGGSAPAKAGGLDLSGLNVGPKKGSSPGKKKGKEAPKKAAPVAKPVVAPKAEAVKEKPADAKPKIELPKSVNPPAAKPAAPVVKKAEPVAAPVVKKEAPAAVETKEADILPDEGEDTAVASPAPVVGAPKAGGKGKKSRSSAPAKGKGGIGSLFSFNSMIAPNVIKLVYFLLLIFLILTWLGTTLLVALSSMMQGSILMAIISGSVFFVFGGVGTLSYIIIVRVACEAVLVFFQINDNLEEVKEAVLSRNE